MTCKEQINHILRRRIKAIRQTMRHESDLDFCDLGIAFDYVPSDTFNNRRGYYRFQLATQDPQEEFRFFCDNENNITSIEFWLVDWGDGAKRTLRTHDLELLQTVFQHFEDDGSVWFAFDNARTKQA